MQGLEVYNSDGSLQFTTSDALSRFLTSFSIGQSAGSLFINGLNTGRPLAIVAPLIGNNTSFLGVGTPRFTFDTVNQIAYWPASSFASGYTVAIVVY